MKRFSIIALLFAAIVSTLWGVIDSNRQKIFSIDSDVYRAIRNLYIAEGMALPSTTGPWSAAELDMMLRRVEEKGVSEASAALYEYAKSELGRGARFNPGEGFGFTIGMDADVEIYAHTNKDDFADPDDYARSFWSMAGDWNRRAPFLSVPLETWIGDNIYGYSSFDIGVSRTILGLSDSITGGQTQPIGSSIMHNIPIVPPTSFADITLTFPYRAFGSIGGEWWNFSVGRDKLSWGPGVTGNLIVGDQLPYHDNARFTAFTNWFKYTFSMSAFIHPMNYMRKAGDNNYYYAPKYSQLLSREGIRMFIAHRLEWRIFDKVNMALTESIMYQSKDNQFDFLVLSPTAIFHNYYIRSNANSLLSFEFNWTFVDHWNLYGEAVIDEFKLPGEFTNDGPPSAYGFILGVKTAYPLDGGMLYGSIEGAYTYPYLYLRQVNEETTSGDPKYGLNFIVDTPDVLGSGGTKYTLDYLGYRYGNDSVVGNLKVGYEKFGKWKAEFDFTYWADGTMDMYSKWARTTPGVDDPVAPTPEHDKGTSGTGGSWLPEGESNWESRNAVAHWFILTLSGEWNIIDRLNLYGQIRFLGVLNAGNIRGETATDFQISLGLSYSF